jgi:hypothetical protein
VESITDSARAAGVDLDDGQLARLGAAFEH